MTKLDVMAGWPLSDAETTALVAIALFSVAMLALVTLPAIARLCGVPRGFMHRLATVWPSRVRNVAPTLMLTCAPRTRRHAARGPNGRFVKADPLPLARSAMLPHLGSRRSRV